MPKITLREKMLELEQENHILKEQNKALIEQLKATMPIHNARGAGRKVKFTDEEVERIKALRKDGNTMRRIAKEMNCSPALVCKILHNTKD